MAKLASVLKYEGDNTTFVWKHPVEDFYTGTQLIVHETQEAIFFMNGQALDTFTKGEHVLETQNMPLLAKLFNKPFGDQTPYHCEIYFINLTEQMAVTWGAGNIEYVNPIYNFPMKIGASGEMSLKVNDSRKLLVKIVGTERGLTQQSLVQKFRGIMAAQIKAHLAKTMRSENIDIFSVDEHLMDMSSALLKLIAPTFDEYGLTVEQFVVTAFAKPEGDPKYERLKDLRTRKTLDIMDAQLRQEVEIIDEETAAKRTVIQSQAKATSRAVQGYTYQDERSYDVAERVAANEAIGEMSNVGIGIGMIGGIGGAVSGMMSNALGAATSNAPKSHALAENVSEQQITCPQCNSKLPSEAKFCSVCGQAIEQLSNSEMICNGCGRKVPKGKFCIFCGTSTTRVCSNCGNELPNEAKFCLNCGKAQ